MATIRALDVGYGYTKYTALDADARRIAMRSFPSIVCAPSHIDLSSGLRNAGVLEGSDTITVEADGRHHEVGPGIERLFSVSDARPLHPDYTETPEYLALARGALYAMDTPEIDLLVTGLPVRYLTERSKDLVKRLQGTHVVKGRSIVVREVQVIAQPMGGFIDYASKTQELRDVLREQASLVLDPGYYTFDWVMARGLHPVARFSGHHEGGVSSVLQKIATELGKDFHMDYTDVMAIDRALRRGRLTVNRQEVQIRDYVRRAIGEVEKAVTAVQNAIGRNEVHNIVLVGGGARLFRPAIEERFADKPIHVVENEMFANVRGFQICGEQLFYRRQVA